jgi:hypothetical protein
MCSLILLAATSLRAQELTLGASAALADYREQGPALQFRGMGISGHATLHWKRFGAQIRLTHLSTDESDADLAAAEPFDLLEADVRVGVRVTSRLGGELGFLSRSIDPQYAAQSMRAWRAGAAFTQPLAPGADVVVRAAYLGATHFGGGGSAPFGFEVGLAGSYGPGSGRVRLTAEYDFQRVDRRTTVAAQTFRVPIQLSVARLGVAAQF